MFKRNRNKLLSSSLLATLLVAGFTSQGAMAMVIEQHETKSAVSEQSDDIRIGRAGPRGEIVIDHENDATEAATRANLGGQVGPLPTPRVRSN